VAAKVPELVALVVAELRRLGVAVAERA
jgi:hypothetical protein